MAVANFNDRLRELIPNGIEIKPHVDNEGKTYWSACLVDCKPVVGGGDTPGEAIVDVLDNLEAFVQYVDEYNEVQKYVH